jgi:hypothetical protein
MSNINAGQHIYGNVEKSESPSNIGGFQTLFYSKDFLSESESDEIERRLGYYPSEENPEKLIFFKMGEKFVLSQIIPLEDMDKFGRKGAYVAHSFVFLKKDFEKFNFNPFVIFDLYPGMFIKTLNEALTKGKKGEMNIPPVEFIVNSESIHTLEIEMGTSVKKWNGEGVKKLVSLAMNEQKMKGEAKSFIISGTQTEIRNTIKAIFSLAPDIIRSMCSFDTYFVGCNPVATKYWTYGYPKAPNQAPQLILVNTETRTISNVNIDSRFPYENWIFGGNYQDNIKKLCEFRNTAFELDQFLSNKEYNQEKILEYIESSDLETFLEINKLLLYSKLQLYFKEILSENLARYATRALITKYDSKANAILLKKLLMGFDKDEISNYLFDEIKLITTPSNQDINDLNAFLAKNKHKLLKILYLKWTENSENLQRSLNDLDDNEYKIAIELLLGNVELKSLIINTKISLFTEIFVSDANEKRVLQDNIPDLIKILLNLDQESLLSEIIPLIPKLNRTQTIFIQDYIAEQNEEKRKKIPDEFTKSLKDNVEISNQKGGMFTLGNLANNFPFIKKK